MKWEHKDWIWLLIVIFCLSTAFFIQKPNLNTILSYISSFVSVALAGVAIYISIREVTKADSVKEDIHKLIGELNEKVGQIDHKLNKIDLTNVQRTVDTDKLNLLTDLIIKKERKH